MRSRLVPTGIASAWSVLFIAVSTQGAHAYLDAGTGSMILQMLLGGLAGLAIAGKLYWYRLLSLVGLRSEAVDKPDEEDLARTRVRDER